MGALAYGAIYTSYGALTLSSLALSMGSASIAGEEKKGTMGLLLGNPKSRTHVLVAKAANVCIMAMTTLCGEAVVAVSQEFASAGLVSPDWRVRDAAVQSRCTEWPLFCAKVPVR